MKLKLRQERFSDHSAIAALILGAYRDIPYSNHKEQIMVERLRDSDAFIPALSIVAENDNQDLVGHILFTKIQIRNQGQSYQALALAPLSVDPRYQKKGIGKKLVLEGHRVAKELGYNYVIVLGIPNYYPKFEYQFISKFNVSLPIKISDENALIVFLIKNNYLEITGGTVIYSEAFFS